MKLTPTAPQWTQVILEPEFQGRVEYWVDGKLVTLKFTNFAKTSAASLVGSRRIGYLPVTIRPVSRIVGFISAVSNLNTMAKVWVEAGTVNVMPGLNTTETWTDTLYTGQITFTMN